MESNKYFEKSYVQLLLTLILLAVLVAVGAYAHLTLKQARGTYTGDTTITINGEGEVLAKPDIGQFSFSVRAEGSDASEAQANSAEAINAILGYLESAGVAEKDIKTQHYNLNPKYRYEERVCPAGTRYCPPGEPIIDGYEVSQSVQVKVRDLENSGELISGVGERGATNISSLHFTIDDETTLKAEAREKAIANAKDKAKQLADDLGMSVERIVGFHENGGHYPVAYNTRAMDAEMAFDESVGGLAPSLPTGENTIMSHVSIAFELR